MRCRGISRHSSHHISLSANLTNPSQSSHQCRALRWKWQCRDQRDFLLLFWETNGILMHFISLFWNKVKKSWKCEAALLILVLFSFTIITKMHQRLDIKRGILRKQKTHFNNRIIYIYIPFCRRPWNRLESNKSSLLKLDLHLEEYEIETHFGYICVSFYTSLLLTEKFLI